MEVTLKSKNVELARPIRDYIEKKALKLQKFFQGIQSMLR